VDQEENDLPKWFRMASKIARHFLYGVVILFFLLHLDWTSKNIDPKFLGYVNIFLLLIAVPTFIFSGADIIQIIVKILTALKNTDEHK